MKRRLSRRPDKLPTQYQDFTIKVRRLTNKVEILAHLEPKRYYAVTALAHLEQGFPVTCRWLVASDRDRSALCLIAKGIYPNYIFTIGDASLIDQILDSTNLPGRTFITCQPEHLRIIENHYELEWHLPAKRMVVTRNSFVPVEQLATRMKASHVNELNRLYDLEHSGNFTASQIRRGVFHGLWRDEQLVAITGTHLIAPEFGIAYVGNVLTHPAYRNQGLATICASSVTAELLENCTDVVLNVESHNLPAVRAYASLGYVDDCQVIEAAGHRKSFIGVIINSVCKKLGLIPTYKERMEPDG